MLQEVFPDKSLALKRRNTSKFLYYYHQSRSFLSQILEADDEAGFFISALILINNLGSGIVFNLWKAFADYIPAYKFST